MKFYWLPSENRFVARQADIPKGVSSEIINIPLDQALIMERLNGYEARLAAREVPDEPKPAQEESPAVLEETAHDRQLRQLDVEDAIQRAGPVELNAYATHVFDRFKDLMKNSHFQEK